jgi:hypothetical protein
MDLASLPASSLGTVLHPTILQAFPGWSYWTGGSDAAQEGTWRWSAGHPWSYSNWDAGQPQGSSNENCAVVMDNGKWHDQPCSTGFAALCGPVGE